jgi:DNA-directed RNA polymerase specialized sigma24 family protein
MARKAPPPAEADVDVASLLLAVAALLADQREAGLADRPGAIRTEVLLADVGLSSPQIARIVGKQPAAVRMAISRARKRSGGASEEPA